MKKTLKTVLLFVVVLAVLLGAAALAERLRPERTADAEETPLPKETVITNVMTPGNATHITLTGDGASILGVGAAYADGELMIAYPGTYRLSGSLNGQIVVDLGDFTGGVYLMLDGVSVSCDDGPALYVRQADLTELYLCEGTLNSFRDGAAYVVQEGAEQKSGAAIYSADDLCIGGEGTLTAAGCAADGIRSKDALIINSGVISVSAADDGLQGSDFIEIGGGELSITAGGDGVHTTKGHVTITGGRLRIESGGDGVAAATELTITDGDISVTACGGPENHAYLTLHELSAKGLKAADISLTGGRYVLTTADDAVHGDYTVAITDAAFTIASGDDAVRAEELTAENVSIEVLESYEGLEAEWMELTNVWLAADAENNAVSAGEGGVTAENSVFVLTAPRGIRTEGKLSLYGGSVTLYADGTDSVFSFAEAEVTGSAVTVCAQTNDASVLLEKGELDNSLLFLFRDAVTAGTDITIADDAGNVLQTVTCETDVRAVLYTSGALCEGRTYTVTAGGTTLSAVVGEGCTTVEPEGGLTAWQSFGGFGGGPMPGGGGPRPQ